MVSSFFSWIRKSWSNIPNRKYIKNNLVKNHQYLLTFIRLTPNKTPPEPPAPHKPSK